MFRLIRPARVLKSLALHGRCEFGDWRVSYIARKRLVVTHKPTRRTATIRDAAVWYATGLDAAATKWLGKRKLPVPASWYEDFRAPLAAGKRRRKALLYCMRDAALAVRLWKRCAAGFEKIGVSIVGIASPAGAAARLWRDELRPGIARETQEDFQAAFYGGRFETLRLGRVDGASAWDIRSAYPSAFAQLRSVAGADDWTETDPAEIWRAIDAGHYVAARATVTVPHDAALGALPLRLPSGLVIFPAGRFSGTWTGTELAAARERGTRVEFHRARVLAPVYDSAAFPGIEAMYRRRREAEARGDADESLAIKLTLNGLFGKCAEQRSQYEEATAEALRGSIPSAALVATEHAYYASRRWPGRTAVFPYAAEATARVRVRLLADVPADRLIFTATDGVLLRGEEPPGGPLGDGLGQWSRVGDGLFRGWIVGNGFYFLRDAAGNELDKARGYGRLSFAEFARILRAAPARTRTLLLPGRLRAESLAGLLRGGSVEEMNDLTSDVRTVELDADEKRSWREDRTAGVLRRRCIESDPWLWLGAGTIDPALLIREDKR